MMETKFPWHACAFGTTMMLVITGLMMTYVDFSTCHDAGNDFCKDKVSNMFYGFLVYAWIIYIGGGLILGIMWYNGKQEELKNINKGDKLG